jgi:peptide/nickel transport system ATP-binding protein
MLTAEKLLEIENLSLSNKDKVIINNISFDLKKEETLGLIGASGSGKSLTLWAILNLLPEGIKFDGKVLFGHDNVLRLGANELRRVRGAKIAMIYQEPSNAFNPLRTIGAQILETICSHKKISQKDAKANMIGLLNDVGLETKVAKLYIHQISGGMAQRAAIAMVISTDPEIILADEPTSNLDEENERNILELLLRIKKERGLSMIIVSHDYRVIDKCCDKVIVIESGRIVQEGTAQAIYEQPASEFMRNVRSNDIAESPKKEEIDGATILKVKNLRKYFTNQSGWFKKERIQVLSHISFDLKASEILGLVGGSGSGKSTLANILTGLEPYHGEIEGLDHLKQKERAKEIQIVFQNPDSSLNPSHKIQKILTNVLRFHNIQTGNESDYLEQLLHKVGLEAEVLEQLPNELSGGQKQRICIARAISIQPKILICDECVSALDSSNRKQILDLLLNLRAEQNLSILYISHDLPSVEYLCDRVFRLENGALISLTE